MKYTQEEKRKYMQLYREKREQEVARLDAQEGYFLELIAYAATHKYEDIPERHRQALPVAKASVPGRGNEYVNKRLQETAHLFAKNEIVRARNGQA